MKLIIDIPDEDYTAVRCEALYYIGHDKLAESVTTAFQTATPYEDRPQGEYTEEDMKQAIKENFDIGYEMAKNKYERPQVVLFAENITEEEKQKLIAEFKAVMDNAKLTAESDNAPTVGLIQSLTELCDEYCKNCPITDVPNECTDCICIHIRGIIKGGAE